MTFVDINVFVRVVVNDDHEHTPTAKEFFKKAINTGEFLISEAVINEILYVACSKKLYNLSRQECVGRLLPLLLIKGMKHQYKPELLVSLKLFASSNLDFVDCLAKTYKEAGIVNDIVSFDENK